MVKKNEDLEEIINDDDEFIEDDEIVDDDEFIEDEEEIIDDDEMKSKNSKQKQSKGKKKKLEKGAIAGIVAGSITAVVAIVLVVIFLILPAVTPAATGTIVDVIDFKTGIMEPNATAGIGGLQDYELAPTQTASYDWMYIMTDPSFSDEYKAAAAMTYTQGNELMSKQFAFFRYQVGTTNLGSNSGTLIYERLRRETTNVKYDTTIKMPINHNFNSVAVNFVQSANIRYIKDGVYNRMDCDIKDMHYDNDTGIVYATNWKKQSTGNWNNPQSVNKTPGGYSDLNKVSVWFGSINDSYTIENTTVEEKTIKKGSVEIENKGDYYVISFKVDVNYVNSDSKTTNQLNEDNGGSGITYDYCDIVIEVWNNGFAKSMTIDEKWTGKVKMYNGSAEAKSTIKYSYSDRDTQDTSYPDSQVARINNK